MTIQFEPGAEETLISEISFGDLAKLISYILEVQGQRHHSLLLRLERIAHLLEPGQGQTR